MSDYLFEKCKTLAAITSLQWPYFQVFNIVPKSELGISVMQQPN